MQQLVNVAAQLTRNQRDVCKYVADICRIRAGRLAVDAESPLDIWLILDFGDPVRSPVYLP